MRRAITLVLLGGLLTGCSGTGSNDPGGGSTGDSTASSTSGSTSGATSAAASATASATVSALAEGLLPPGQFGAGYTSTPIAADQLTNLDPAAALGDFTVDPPKCAGISQTLSPFSNARDLAAASVSSSDPNRSAYAEIIVGGADSLGVDLAAARAQVEQCPTATLTASDGTRIDATYSLLDLGDLGDDSLGLQTGAAVTASGQTQQVFGTNALVLDGDRLLALVSIATTAEGVDPGFADLTARAYAYQHDALG